MDATSTGVIIGALITLWLTTVFVAYRFVQRQMQVQMRLQDREIDWSLYVHLLRLDYIEATNKKPRDVPEKLRPFPHDDPHIDKF